LAREMSDLQNKTRKKKGVHARDHVIQSGRTGGNAVKRNDELTVFA
jgi:hypothetical protein